MTVHDSVSQVPELAARVENHKQYNIRILGVPSLVYPSFAATPLCIALSASLFILSFASNSEKCNENKEDKTWVYCVMTRKPKKWSSQQSRRGSQVEYQKHGGDLFFDCEECVHRDFVPSGHTVDQHYCPEQLHRVKQQVRLKHRKRWWKQNRLIHKDNTLGHAALSVKQFFAP